MLFELLLLILEPIHQAGSCGCLLRDIEFPMDPNARPESSYPLIRSGENFFTSTFSPLQIVSTTRPPIHRLLRSTIPSFELLSITMKVKGGGK